MITIRPIRIVYVVGIWNCFAFLLAGLLAWLRSAFGAGGALSAGKSIRILLVSQLLTTSFTISAPQSSSILTKCILKVLQKAIEGVKVSYEECLHDTLTPASFID